MRRLTRLLLPLVPWAMLGVALWRRITGAEPPEAWLERLGRKSAPTGPTVWLHGASNGELASARWVIEAVLAARPTLHLLVTCNTLTARTMVTGWSLPRVTAAFAPLDLAGPLARLLTTWCPKALITVEGEIYPRRFAACAQAGIPVALIGARMSERSYRGWAELQPVMARALAAVQIASAQDAASEDRLRKLGLPAHRLHALCDLKAVATGRLPQPNLPPRDLRATTLLAASTHDGEEAIVLDAFVTQSQFTRLIIAPRHPRRADAVAALVKARGLTCTRRSTGAWPGTAPADAQVFLADTMGEMDLWYASAGACFVGGSFAVRGGHTPWEPARFASAILHGPSVANFAGPYAALDAAGGTEALTSPDQLAATLNRLRPARQIALSSAAAQILHALTTETHLIDDLMMACGL